MTQALKSSYYEVRLRQFRDDVGSTPSNRVLAATKGGRNSSQLDDAAVQYLRTGVSVESQQTIANESVPGETNSGNFLNEVIFNVTPEVSESRTIDYDNQGLQSPNGIVAYRTTGNRSFSITSRFVSRNYTEATLNYLSTNLLRSWTVPQSLGSLSGRPPILRLNGYGNQFYNIPTVISSLSFSFPEDVDYIETDVAMVPIIQSVTLELIESHTVLNIIQYSGVSDPPVDEFNLGLFRAGRLPGY